MLRIPTWGIIGGGGPAYIIYERQDKRMGCTYAQP